MQGHSLDGEAALLNPPSPTFAVMVKLLLSNEQCGALIGKGGGTIVGIQDRYAVVLKLGGPDDLFPGTLFRSAVVRGIVSALRGSLEAVVSTLWQVRVRRACPARP